MHRACFHSVLGAVLVAGVTLAAWAALSSAARPVLEDVLDTPARVSDFARSAMVSAVARRNERMIAVGARGVIHVSRDGAATWRQVPGPVSTDLVAVRFVDDKTAWAIGHDAVALRSDDSGETWARVLDGRSVAALMRKHYGDLAKAGDAAAEKMLKEVDASLGQSATPDVLPSPSSTCGSRTGTKASWWVPSGSCCTPPTQARAGSPGSTARTTTGASTSMGSAGARASAGSSASRAS